jgi:hypothetical protein
VLVWDSFFICPLLLIFVINVVVIADEVKQSGGNVEVRVFLHKLRRRANDLKITPGIIAD